MKLRFREDGLRVTQDRDIAGDDVCMKVEGIDGTVRSLENKSCGDLQYVTDLQAIRHLKRSSTDGDDKVCSHLENLCGNDVVEKFRTWSMQGERYGFRRQLSVARKLQKQYSNRTQYYCHDMTRRKGFGIPGVIVGCKANVIPSKMKGRDSFTIERKGTHNNDCLRMENDSPRETKFLDQPEDEVRKHAREGHKNGSQRRAGNGGSLDTKPRGVTSVCKKRKEPCLESRNSSCTTMIASWPHTCVTDGTMYEELSNQSRFDGIRTSVPTPSLHALEANVDCDTHCNIDSGGKERQLVDESGESILATVRDFLVHTDLDVPAICTPMIGGHDDDGITSEREENRMGKALVTPSEESEANQEHDGTDGLRDGTRRHDAEMDHPIDTTVTEEDIKLHAQAMEDVLQAYVGQDFMDTAPDEIMNNIKRISEEMGSPLRILRSEYFQMGRRYKNALIKQASLEFAMHVREGKIRVTCPYNIQLRVYLYEFNEESERKDSSNVLLGQCLLAFNAFDIRVFLMSSPCPHDHVSHRTLLRKHLGKEMLDYAKKMQTEGFMRFPELVQYLEKKLSIRIDVRSIRRQLEHLTHETNPWGRKCMNLLERLQLLR